VRVCKIKKRKAGANIAFSFLPCDTLASGDSHFYTPSLLITISLYNLPIDISSNPTIEMVLKDLFYLLQ
jgi:hypothetical protein